MTTTAPQQMQAVADPAAQVRRFAEAMMRQAVDPALASAIRVVIWNGHRVGDDTRRRGASRERLAQLLVAPVAALGSRDPERDALLTCYACMLRMEEFLWRRESPSADDIEHVAAYCLRAIGADRG